MSTTWHKRNIHLYRRSWCTQGLIKEWRSLNTLTKIIVWLTFMGRSRPDEDLWRHTPRSAEPEGKQIYHIDLGHYKKISEVNPFNVLNNLLLEFHSKLHRNVNIIVKYSALHTKTNSIMNFKLFLFLYLKRTLLMHWRYKTYQEALDSLLVLATVCRFLHA